MTSAARTCFTVRADITEFVDNSSRPTRTDGGNRSQQDSATSEDLTHCRRADQRHRLGGGLRCAWPACVDGATAKVGRQSAASELGFGGYWVRPAAPDRPAITPEWTPGRNSAEDALEVVCRRRRGSLPRTAGRCSTPPSASPWRAGSLSGTAPAEAGAEAECNRADYCLRNAKGFCRRQAGPTRRRWKRIRDPEGC